MPASRTNQLLLLGHRGARAFKSIPENSLASFDHALADGCDGFEFDVRLTADSQAVICHAPRIKRTDIAKTSAQELNALAGLREVLSRYQDRAFLDIELKVAGLEKITLDLLKEFPPVRGFVVSSFLPSILEAVHDENEAVPLGLICEKKSQLKWWTKLPVVYVVAQTALVNAALIDKLKTAGKKIFVWTVNSPAQMQRLANLGVDGIISDKTDLLCRILRG
ncbi:MAG TPA: glycerophosphodiester phosphodiesterase [Candidatus Sulfotelmatobacter sp.]|nr:glycerophosphodiester phosphodiesterase [Candidatus Sulfotelmatobacter sp.]